SSMKRPVFPASYADRTGLSFDKMPKYTYETPIETDRAAIVDAAGPVDAGRPGSLAGAKGDARSASLFSRAPARLAPARVRDFGGARCHDGQSFGRHLAGPGRVVAGRNKASSRIASRGRVQKPLDREAVSTRFLARGRRR